MASNPPGSCCYQGVKHEGTPTGELSQLGDFEIYTKYPENKNTEYGVLMYVTHLLIPRQRLEERLADSKLTTALLT
jgi:hypothetical protein